jgi:hypothetical protein
MRADFFNIATYVILNLLLSFSWYTLLFRKKDYLSFTDRLIGTFILSLTQIIFTEMLLGVVFKRLYAMPLFLLNISISLVVLSLVIIFGKNNNPPASHFDKQGQRGILKGVMRGLKGILSEFKDKTIQFFNIIKKDVILLCIFILFSISVCWIIFTGYLFPSHAWDALWYHLPMVGYIMQNGAIQENPTPLFISFINTFPKNIELFFLWNTIFLKSDIIVDLSQLPFTMAGVLTIYSICVKLRIKKEYAIYSSFLFFFTPVVILQSTTNYVDIGISVLFLIAINFLTLYLSLRGSQSEPKQSLEIPHFAWNDRIPILLAGLTGGILLGSKGSGPLFVVVLLAVIMIQEVIRRIIISSKDGLRFTAYDSRSYVVFFITPVFLMGGYWYIRNWALYNNPVYPMDVSLFNITLFKGSFDVWINVWINVWKSEPAFDIINQLVPFFRPFYVWLEREEYYFYDARFSGFGPLWFILFLPSIIFSLIYALKKKKYNFLFVFAILIITFLIYPRNWHTRYVIFIVGLGALSFGYMLDYLDNKWSILKIPVILLVVYTFFTSNSPCVTPLKIKEFIALPAKERTIAKYAPFNIDMHVRKDYGLWIWISNNVLKGDTLAYTFEPLFLYPLWNSELSNKIVYIKSEDYNKWMEELKKNNVTYVLIRQNSIEDKWIDKAKELLGKFWWFGVPQERFKVVYSDEIYKIVRVIK